MFLRVLSMEDSRSFSLRAVNILFHNRATIYFQDVTVFWRRNDFSTNCGHELVLTKFFPYATEGVDRWKIWKT